MGGSSLLSYQFGTAMNEGSGGQNKADRREHADRGGRSTRSVVGRKRTATAAAISRARDVGHEVWRKGQVAGPPT